MTSTFVQRTLVNGGMLRQFGGKNVSIMLHVQEETSRGLSALSTDGHEINVTLTEPLGARKGDWVEVIGTPQSSNAVRAIEAIRFGEEHGAFDEDAYNRLVLFMSNCKIYKHG